MTEVSHDDAASFVAGALEPDEDAAFAGHLAECASCRADVVWLSELAVAVLELGAKSGTAPDTS